MIGIDTVFPEGSSGLSAGDRTGRSWVVRPEEVASHLCEGLNAVRDCGERPETKEVH